MIEYPKTIQLWSDDIQFVIDELEDMNRLLTNKKISGRIDLEKISLIGFSMGGMASMEASINDPRIKAVINLDGPATKNSFTQGVPVTIPFNV